MQYDAGQYDVIVIGAGHAGVKQDLLQHVLALKR